MLKLSRTGIGLLSAQYRSVLKKCLVFNLGLVGVLMSASPAHATVDPIYNHSYLYDSSNVSGSSIDFAKMGNQINTTTTYVNTQGLFLHGDWDSEILGGEIAGITNGTDAWIISEGLLGVGYEYDGATATVKSTTINNKHNVIAESEARAGGALFNHNNDNGNSLMYVEANMSGNSATYFLYDTLSAGGAIANISSYNAEGHIDTASGPLISDLVGVTTNTIKNSNMVANYVMNFGQAAGGAVYNNAFQNTTGVIIATMDSMNNHYSYNSAGNHDITTASSYVKQYILGTEGSIPTSTAYTWKNSDLNDDRVNGMSDLATGGAIYNGGTFTSVQDTYCSNYAIGKYAQGGAIYNAEDFTLGSVEVNPTFTLSDVVTLNDNYVKSEEAADHTVGTVTGGKAQGGGIYNAGLFNIEKKGAIYGNKAIAADTAQGGAIYNEGTMNISVDAGKTIEIYNNKAISDIDNAQGGAIYNAGTMNMTLAAGGTIDIHDNMISNVDNKGEGGAIYNEGTLNINSDSGSIIFQDNEANKGKSLYNTGNVTANLSGNAEISFSSEHDFYNDTGATATYNLFDSAKLVFDSYCDQADNYGTVNVVGDSDDPVVPSAAEMQTASIDTSATQFIVNGYNAYFGGTGVWNISNTQFNLSSGANIYTETNINLSNNIVNIKDTSQLRLSSSDTLVNNVFDIDSDARLSYKDTSSSDAGFYLANTIYNTGTVKYEADAADTDIRLAHAAVNSNIIDVADKLITNVHIDTLSSKDGNQIVVNLDNPNLKADVLTINNRVYNTTNIIFRDMTNAEIGEVTLEEDEKIYFAKTQNAQDLSEYDFTVNAFNSEYTIEVGYEENGAVYDWFLYRDSEPVPPEPPVPTVLTPEELAYIDLPRAAVEQTRGIVFDVTRGSKGVCTCYADNCNNRYCKYENAPGQYSLWAKPTYRKGTYDKPLETDFKLKGVEFGFDYMPTYNSTIGLFGSYRDGHYENDGGKVGKKYYSPLGGSELDLKTYLAGLYFRNYYGNFYFLGAGYFGKTDVDIEADSDVKASTDGINVGAQAEMGYDIHADKRTTITPLVRATYDYMKFDDLTDSAGKKAEFDTINDIELEAALKFEYQFNNENQLPTTAYVKPSVIQTIENGGKVKVNDVEYDDTLDNETLGRIEVGGDVEFIENFSLGVFGNYTFGSDYSAWGVGGNVKYTW